MAVTIFGLSKLPTQFKSLQKMLPFFGASAVIFVMMILGKAASFLWRMLLLRENVAFLGEIELFSTTLGLAVTFSTLAFPAALIRFSLRNKAKSLSYLVYSFKQVFQAFLVVGGALWIFSKFGTFLTPNTQLPLSIFLVIVLLSIGHRLALAYANSQKKFTLYGLGEYVFAPGLKLILLLGILLGVFQQTFLFPHVLWSLAIAALITLTLAFRRKIGQSAPSLSINDQKTFRSYSFFLSGSFLAFMVYSALDIYLLQYFFESTTVGIYVGMLTLINLMDLLFLPFLHTFPAHLAEKKQLAARIVFTTSTAGLLVKIGLLLGLCLAIFGVFFFPVLSGDVLRIPFLVLLAFTIYKTAHYGLVHVYRHYLDFQGEQVFTARTMFASLAVKALFCFLFVPSMGIAGLAAANIITDLLHSWLLLRRIRSSA